MSELLLVLFFVVGFIVFPAVIIGWIFFGGRKQSDRMIAHVARMTPHQTLAEAALSANGTVELRATAITGAHKIWLESNLASTDRDWSVSVSVVHRCSPPGSGYRDKAGDADAIHEASFIIGDDGEGRTTRSAVGARRTGTLGLPRGGNLHWLQLVAFPELPPGSDLFVRVTLGEVKNAQSAVFRAFIGVSVA